MNENNTGEFDLYAVNEKLERRKPTEVHPIEQDRDGDLENIAFSCQVDHTGTAIYLKGWRHLASEQSPFLIVHDFGEHISLYRDFANSLRKNKVSVYGFDLRGHGRSGRRLGHTPSFDALVTDLLQIIAWIKHIEGGLKPIVIGHGIGALIALKFAHAYSHYVNQLILTAPAFCFKIPLKKSTKMLIHFLKEIFPTQKLWKKLRPQTGDAQLLDKMYRLPGKSFHKAPKMTNLFASEIIKVMEQSIALLSNSTLMQKTKIIIPGQDEIYTYGPLQSSQVIICEDTGHHMYFESPASIEKIKSLIFSLCENKNP